ncbi:mitogen-activated protein kinase kinase kinase 13 [Arabidopsis thaliana]|uniref:Mitogen-activated protein kinase kinase kinase 13 n=1 Tax=Arabidopsis thaliana TaxID=3702 RepID=F4HNX7_ARATH|nr:mitogen-activated protein kinase kinase kinase 13 [Arabidopsis thaliana]AEE28083.1 mitogen-activated protein kinase kinase kinase 13 [Arabidopsis thaliana]|eukprot:NP_001184927.1 mitogen-activated protein kinase kinase kinase 13 [Arabidopsis thaliana]
MLSSPSSFWVRGACIGRGCFGAVSTAISKTNGEVFAVKSVDLATSLPTQSESLENEISVFRSLKPHPYIVKFLGDGVSKEGTTTFRNLYLEYLPNGDVASHRAGGKIEDETLLQRYTACLVSALRHVHSQGFVHCDVKARNILVSQSSMVKLADFGSAFRIHTPRALITPRGSPLWMAPEVIRREYQGPESDVWSLGCTIIEMFTGKPAWEDHGIDSLSRISFSDELPVFPSKLSEIGRDFLEKCLKRDPNQRWSCDQLLQHPFLSQCHNSSPTESSPRCVLDWVNSGFDLEEEEEEVGRSEFEDAAKAIICNLATTGGVIWESDGWVEVRCHASEEEGTTMEYSGSTRVESEYNTSSDPNDDVAGDSAIIDVSMSQNLPPGNGGSAAALPYEFVVVLHLLMEIMVYTTCIFREIVLTMYLLYQYNQSNKLETLSFNHSLKFCLFAHVIRIGQNYLLRGLKDQGYACTIMYQTERSRYIEFSSSISSYSFFDL